MPKPTLADLVHRFAASVKLANDVPEVPDAVDQESRNGFKGKNRTNTSGAAETIGMRIVHVPLHPGISGGFADGNHCSCDAKRARRHFGGLSRTWLKFKDGLARHGRYSPGTCLENEYSRGSLSMYLATKVILPLPLWEVCDLYHPN
jgi:hypothetical protein